MQCSYTIRRARHIMWYTERFSLQDDSAPGKIQDFFHGGKGEGGGVVVG